MNASEIEKKYTRIAKINNKWNCYLQIDHQGFCVVENRTKKEARWYGKMLSIALDRLIKTAKNT
jgi:hypothetical protein